MGNNDDCSPMGPLDSHGDTGLSDDEVPRVLLVNLVNKVHHVFKALEVIKE